MKLTDKLTAWEIERIANILEQEAMALEHAEHPSDLVSDDRSLEDIIYELVEWVREEAEEEE